MAVGSIRPVTRRVRRPRSGLIALAAAMLATLAATQLPASGATATSPKAPTGSVVFDGTPVTFGPATIVDAHLLCGEPQGTIEGGLPNRNADATSNDRAFIDCPWSSRTQTDLLHRTTDGGKSFRLLYDPKCAQRSRPSCLEAGGGDSEETVSPVTGNVYFLDQEGVLIQEGLSSSTDHGDTFPENRQFAVTNSDTVTDRQWLTWTDDSVSVGGETIDAFMSYHTPPLDYIQGIGLTDGEPIPQPIAQLQNVGQSGQPRMDVFPDSPGYQYLYYPYWNFPTGSPDIRVATAFAPDYQNPAAWVSNHVANMAPDLFVWSAVDQAGNSYVSWVSRGRLFYAYSNINDPANDPGQGGRPGTKWGPPTQLNPPGITDVALAEVYAGAPGHIALNFIGTDACKGFSDLCPHSALWDDYVVVLSNALQEGGTPAQGSFGKVSHRHVHKGAVCTGGIGCTPPDRSMLDTLDLGTFEDGSIGVVFEDNYTTMQQEPTEDESPFVHFAREVKGPTLLGTTVQLPKGSSKAAQDAAGDATWPNTSDGVNLPAFDITEAHLATPPSPDTFEAHIHLNEPGVDAAVRDLAAYNAVPQSTNPAERVQYIFRFSTDSEVYHLSFEVLADGSTRAYGGMLNANDRIQNLTASAVVACGYVNDPGFHVTGKMGAEGIKFDVPYADLGIAPGTPIYSVTAFTVVGPLEQEQSQIDPMRTVDASPPFDGSAI